MRRASIYDAGSPAWPNPWEGFLPHRTLVMFRAYSMAPVHVAVAEMQNKFLIHSEGNPRARLMFIGDGPASPAPSELNEENPFVGPTGLLLEKMIEAMGYKRSEVYLAQIVNRGPALTPQEITQCASLLLQQVESVLPEIIVTLGDFATQILLQTQMPVSQLRGTFKSFQVGTRTVPVMPTHHPVYLLQNPKHKRETWEDLKRVRARLT